MLAVGLGVAVAATFLLKPQLALPSIRSIECRVVDASPCPILVSQKLQSLLGSPLLFSRLDQQLEGLLRPVGYTLTSYDRALPDTLKIDATPLDILFYLETEGQLVAITSNGVALAISETTDRPSWRVVSIDPVTQTHLKTTANVPTWLVQTAEALTTFLSSTNTTPTFIELRTPFELELSLPDQPHQVLINPQDAALNLARLAFILKSNHDFSSASSSATLDVRFRLPVLRS